MHMPVISPSQRQRVRSVGFDTDAPVGGALLRTGVRFYGAYGPRLRMDWLEEGKTPLWADQASTGWAAGFAVGTPRPPIASFASAGSRTAGCREVGVQDFGLAPKAVGCLLLVQRAVLLCLRVVFVEEVSNDRVDVSHRQFAPERLG
jgi:hypothetical protein